MTTHNIHQCCCAEHTAVKIIDLSVAVNNVEILSDLSFTIPRGVCTAIVGPNGAGKSTLAKAILGEINYKGQVLFGGSDGKFSNRKPRWGYVPQKLQFDRDMPITVMEFLAANLSWRPVFLGINKALKARCMAMLEEMNCAHTAFRKLGKLSGGELQRVLLSLALLQEPEIILLDEPAAGVDFQGERLCCDLLEKIRRERNFTQIMISHDLSTVAAHAAHVVCLNHRLVAQGHPASVLTEKNLQTAFGIHAGKVAIANHSEVCTCRNH